MIDTGRAVAALTVIVAIGGWLFYFRGREVRLLSPFSALLLLLASIFGFRPLLMSTGEDFDFYGYDIESGFLAASVIGFAATVCAVVGYAVARALRKASADPDPDPDPDAISTSSAGIGHPSFKAYYVAAVATLLAWYGVMTATGGPAFLSALLSGRSRQNDALFGSLPAFVPGLPVVAAVIVAFGRIAVGRTRAGETIAYWILIALCTIPSAGTGGRRYIIPVIIAGLIGFWWNSGRRLVRPYFVALGALLLFVLAVIPFVRSAGSRTQSTDLAGAIADYSTNSGIEGVLDDFFLKYDTGMFNYVAFLQPRLGVQIPYGWGRGTFVELALAPVPSRYFDITVWSNQILTLVFGSGCRYASACPVPSVVGMLLYDYGWAGIVVGMLLVGALCYRIDLLFGRVEGWRCLAVIVLTAVSTALWRGNPISQLWIATNIFVLAFVVVTLLRWTSATVRRSGNQVVNRITPVRQPEPLSSTYGRVTSDDAAAGRGAGAVGGHNSVYSDRTNV